MTAQGGTYQQVTVSEAAALLGVSKMTVRRMLKRGQLEGERVHRPQGSAYVVRVPVDGTAGHTDAPSREQPAGHTVRTNGTGPGMVPAAEAMVSLIQTTIGTVLGPLVAELAASRQTVERQAERVAELERENGRQAAELDALRAQNGALEPSESTEDADADPDTESVAALLRLYGPFVLGVVLAVIGGLVVLLAR